MLNNVKQIKKGVNMKQTKTEFSITLETAEPTDKTLAKFLQGNKIKTTIIEKASKSHSGFDEIEYKADSKKVLENLIAQFWHDDTLKENIE
jgi:hypothetical protein